MLFKNGWSLSLLLAISTALQVPGQPVNDNFANRITLSGYPIPLAPSTVNNVGATVEPGEPLVNPALDGSTVWWTWTSPITGYVTVDTSYMKFTHSAAVYTGSSLGQLVLVAHNSPPGNTFLFNAVAGTAYQIQIGRHGTAIGPVFLSLYPGESNDNFANRITLTGFPVLTTGTNVGASVEVGEPLLNPSIDSSTVWWTWTSPVTGPVTVDTTGTFFTNDTAVYTGSSLGQLALVASNAPGQRVFTLNAVAGTAYQMQVASWGVYHGTLTLSLYTEPPNDNFSNSIPLTGLPVSATGFLSGATIEGREPLQAGTGNATVWWNWTSPISGFVTLDLTGTDAGGSASVYTGSALDELKLVPTAAPQNSFYANAGTNYQIQIGGALEQTRNLQFKIAPFAGNATNQVWQLVLTNVTTPFLAADNAGDYFVAGTRQNNTLDLWAAKADPSGRLVWQATYDSPGGLNDTTVAVAADFSNNVVLLGASQDPLGATTMDLVKYSANGALLWSTQFVAGAGTNVFPSGLGLDGAGDIYVAGNIGPANGLGNIFLTKYSPGGTLLWTTNYPSANQGNANPPAIAVDSAGNVYIAGTAGVFFQAASGQQVSAGITLKYGPNGLHLWTFSEANSSFSFVQVGTSGNIYVAGQYSIQGYFPRSFFGDTVAYKLDPRGNSLWSYALAYDVGAAADPVGSISPLAMGLDAAENVYIAGNVGPSQNEYRIKVLGQGGAGAWTNVSFGGVPSGGAPSAVSSAGYLFATSGSQIFEYDPHGNLVGQWQTGPASLTTAGCLFNSAGALALVQAQGSNVFLDEYAFGPTLTNNLANQSVASGAKVFFTIGALGAGVAFQWQFNGVNIPGAINNVLVLNAVTPKQAGVYTVFVSNPVGSSSSSAFLSVDGLAGSYFVNPQVSVGGAIQFTAVGVPGAKYGLYGSTNFTNWVLVNNFTNVTGNTPLGIPAPGTNGIQHQFFRLQSGP